MKSSEIITKQTVSQNRLDYIDIAKGIGILLVVFNHCAFIGTTNCIPHITDISSSFYMPFFFFLSGYLYKLKPTKDFLYSRTKGLLIPDAIVHIINYFIAVACGVFSLDSETFKLSGFWFLEALFLVSIIYYLFNLFLVNVKFIKKKDNIDYILFAGSVLMSVFGILWSVRFDVGANRIFNAFCGIFFYSLGHIFHKQELQIPNKYIENRLISLVLGVVLIIITSITAQYAGEISMAYNKYGNPILFLICSLAGTFGVFFISKAIKHSKVLSFYGQNSLTILTTHFPIFGAIRILLLYISSNFVPMNAYVILAIVFVLTIIIEVPLIYLINKYFPIYAGKIKNEII